MAEPHRQYNRWIEIPQQHTEQDVDSINESIPPPRPPEIPVFEVSGGLATTRPYLGYPKTHEEAVPEWKSRSFKPKRLGGLGLILRVYAGLTLLILLVNIYLFIWASTHFDTTGGYGTILKGVCATSKSLNLWLHLAINILSSGLLLGSATFVAAATAPSREDVDLAHRK